MPEKPDIGRIANWNIQQGGGDGEMPSKIMDEIDKIDGDIAILTEVKYKNVGLIKDRLAASGLIHVATTCVEGGRNSVLVAARESFEVVHQEIRYDQERWLPVYFPGRDLHMAAVHIPSSRCHLNIDDEIQLKGNKRKGFFWEEVLNYAADHMWDNAIIVGDFNTGSNDLDRTGGARFTHAKQRAKLRDRGFEDGYRLCYPGGRDSTWWSMEDGGKDHNGFRLDQIHASMSVWDAIRDVQHVQHVRGTRESGKLSDHAMMFAEMDWGRIW